MSTEVSKFQPMLEALERGDLTPSQLSIISQSLHVGMLSSALDAVQENDALLASLKPMEESALGFLEERFQEALPTMTYGSILEFLGEVSNIRNESIKAKLKIYSTRDLFNINPISEEDRALLALFRKVDTPEKKSKLRALLDSLDDNIIDVPTTLIPPTADGQ